MATGTRASEFSRYHALATERTRRCLGSAAVTTGLSVSLGVPAALLLLDPQAVAPSALADSFRALASLPTDAALRDSAGHARPVYRPLVTHLCLAAFAKRFESLPQHVWGACERLTPDVVAAMRRAEAWADDAPPVNLTDLALWQALCIAEQAKLLGRDIDAEWVEPLVGRIISRPGPGGALHPIGDDSLDAWTYRELCGLHALANLALLRRQRRWTDRVGEAAAYHVQHSQPDHTTTQPWALLAFVWSDDGALTAQQQLHDAQTAGDSVLTGLLLADAAAALAALT